MKDLGGRAVSERMPALPELDPGIQLLATGSENGIEPLQALVLDRVLLHNGPAFWVDSGRHAVTTSLRELAPSDRALDRIQIARGFTAYQHTSLLRHLRSHIQEDVPSIIVAPAIDAHYRGDDVQGDTGERMLVSALADLARAARDAGVPVLTTRTKPDDFTAPIEALADDVIEYEETPHGPRFLGHEFETIVYPLGGGWVQTTIAYWHQILEAREPLYVNATASSSQEVSIGGAY